MYGILHNGIMEFAARPHAKVCLTRARNRKEVFEGEGAEEEGDSPPPRY